MSHTQDAYAGDNIELRFLIEKNADGIIVVDDCGIALFANPAAEKLFGRPAEALIGSPVGIPVVAGETADIAILRPGGEKLDVEVRVVATTWNGRAALLASLRDVSSRRIIEERLRQAAKLDAVGRLTAGIAHDFNNLLTVIIGNIARIQRDASRDPGLAQAANDAMSGALRAAGLTQRLLAFSRQQPLDIRPVEINQLVSGMSDLLRRTLAETIVIDIVLDAGASWIQAAPMELEAAILNLAVNARDAMPSGGRLVIETRTVELDKHYASPHGNVEPGAYVLIAVTDTGTGMNRETIERAFEPFFTTKGIGQGTGLGLSQVYNFVRQVGGHVNIYSETGAGTTVKMYFPALTGFEPEVQPVEIARSIPRGAPSECILVVEDDRDVRHYSAGSLRELGYRVLEATDGTAALEIVERTPEVRLLFSDIGLPGGLNGRALAECARRKRPGLKVLLTTAYPQNALAPERQIVSGADIILKPFTLPALATKIRELFDEAGENADMPSCILVVEDEALVRDIIIEMLAELGCATEEAASASEALDKLASLGRRLSAVITDLHLPDRCGDELAGDIRAKRPDIPLILMTGDGGKKLRRSFAAQQRCRILGKPFDLRALRLALESLAIPMRQAAARTGGE